MRTLLLLTALLFLAAACAPASPLTEAPSTEGPESYALATRQVQMLDDGTPYLVHPDEIRGGGPQKDGIPSIDAPRYTTVALADEWIEDNELVLAIQLNGVTRVYPLQILVWHEIVNDVIGGENILITYCPLCGSGIAYQPLVQNENVEFGTSGKLWNSNLVMYDRKTETYWSQIDGIAILGELAGERLKAVSIDTVVWRDWKEAHPESEVLSQDTGHDRAYGRDPYGSYYEDSFLIFPVDNNDESVHPKTVVFGIEVDGSFLAFREDDLIQYDVLTAIVGGIPVTATRAADGVVTVQRDDTGMALVKERDFWFAWYAFHPDTQLYQP